MFITVFLFAAVSAYERDCDQKIKVLTEHGPSNENGYFFVNKTYGGFESCTTIKNRDEFRKLIVDFPVLTFIIKLKFQLNGVVSVPKANNIPELQECNVNIYGNLVMKRNLFMEIYLTMLINNLLNILLFLLSRLTYSKKIFKFGRLIFSFKTWFINVFISYISIS